jgi:ABC-type uncharacterized transport system auxiliary subunit
MTNKTPMHAWLVLMLSWLLLGGCSGLLTSDRPAATTWWLQPFEAAAQPAVEARQPLALTLAVVPGLDTNELLTMEPGAQLNRVAGAYWADHLPELLTSLVLRSLPATGRFSAPVAASRAPAGGCLLSLQVQGFWLQLDAAQLPRSADIMASGTLSCPDTGLSMPLRLSTSTPVSSTDRPALVAAMQRSFNGLVEELLARLATA